MKVLPSLSQATSVTWRNRPSSAGSGGLGCFSGAVSSSEASCLRPNTIRTRPSESNLITMSEPLSVTQMRSEEHTSELQSRGHLVCRLLLEKKKKTKKNIIYLKKKNKKKRKK